MKTIDLDFDRPELEVVGEKGKLVVLLETNIRTTLAGKITDPSVHKLISRIDDEQAFVHAYKSTIENSFAHEIFDLMVYFIQIAESQGLDVETGINNMVRWKKLQK